MFCFQSDQRTVQQCSFSSTFYIDLNIIMIRLASDLPQKNLQIVEIFLFDSYSYSHLTSVMTKCPAPSIFIRNELCLRCLHWISSRAVNEPSRSFTVPSESPYMAFSLLMTEETIKAFSRGLSRHCVSSRRFIYNSNNLVWLGYTTLMCGNNDGGFIFRMSSFLCTEDTRFS